MDEKSKKRSKQFLSGFEKRKLLDKKKLKIESEKCLKITQMFQKSSDDLITLSSSELPKTDTKKKEMSIHKSSYDIPTNNSDLMCIKNKIIDIDVQKSSDNTIETCNSDLMGIENEISINIPSNENQHLDISPETETSETVDPFQNLFIKPNINELQTFFHHHPFQTISIKGKVPFKPKKVFFRDDGCNRKWLSYNNKIKKFFCTICLAFSSVDGNNTFVSGMFDFKHIYSRIDEHEKSKLHLNSTEAFLMYQKNKNIQSLLFKDQLSKRAEEISKRRIVFERIIDVVKLIGRRGLSYRGKFEGINHLSDKTLNHGNFLDILMLLGKYDASLSSHIQTIIQKSEKSTSSGRSQNLTLISKTTVNYIFMAFSKLLKQHIATKVDIAGMFSVQIDTTQDVTVSDICSIIIRYVSIEPIPKVNEHVLSILSAKELTGKSLFQLVENSLIKNNIDVKMCVGSSTDGASNMRGQYQGFSAWLTKVSPQQLHVWCYAHKLNLVLIDIASMTTQAISLFGLLNSCAVFFRESYKRMDVWRHVTKDSRVLNLIGETRWWAKDVALKKCFGIFNDPSNSLFIIIIQAFQLIAQNTEHFNNDARYKATTYLNSLTNFETIITAQLFLKIFQNTTPLSKYLQTNGMCILQAKSIINVTLKTLKSESRNFEIIYEAALKFVNWANKNLEEQNIDLEVQESFFEVRSKTKKKLFGEKSIDNIIVDKVEKFKINVVNITMDSVINNIEYRFKNENELTEDLSYLDPKYFKQIKVLPESAFEKLCNSLNSFHLGQNATKIKAIDLKEELVDFIKKWPELRYSSFDEIKNLDKTLIHDDMEEFNIEVEGEEEENYSDFGQQCNDQKKKCCYNCIFCCFNILVQYKLYSNAYYNLFIVYKYVLSLSSTQVACERSFSSLKYIKTRLRNRLTDEHLETMMLMHINNDILEDIQTEHIIQEVASYSSVLKKALLI